MLRILNNFYVLELFCLIKCHVVNIIPCFYISIMFSTFAWAQLLYGSGPIQGPKQLQQQPKSQPKVRPRSKPKFGLLASSIVTSHLRPILLPFLACYPEPKRTISTYKARWPQQSLLFTLHGLVPCTPANRFPT